MNAELTLDLGDTNAVLAAAEELIQLTRAHDNARLRAEGMPFFEHQIAWYRAADALFEYASSRLGIEATDITVVAEAALLDLAVRSVMAGDFPGWPALEIDDFVMLGYTDVAAALERAGIGRPGAFDREDAWVVDDPAYAVLYVDLPGDLAAGDLDELLDDEEPAA